MTNYQFICYHSTAHQFYIGDGNRNKKANYSCICYYSTAHHCHIGSRTNRNKNTYYWCIRYLTALFSRFTLVVEKTEVTTSSVQQDSTREQSQLSLKKKEEKRQQKGQNPFVNHCRQVYEWRLFLTREMITSSYGWGNCLVLKFISGLRSVLLLGRLSLIDEYRWGREGRYSLY